jgi:hypothetical protein
MKKSLLLLPLLIAGCSRSGAEDAPKTTTESRKPPQAVTLPFARWMDDGGVKVSLWVTHTSVEFGLKNESEGKIVRWPAWRLDIVEDEHGNKFEQKPLSPTVDHWKPTAVMAGTVRLQDKQPLPSLSSWSEYPDEVRVDPQTFRNLAVYYESIPGSSKKAKVTVATGAGKKLIFEGEIKDEKPDIESDPKTKHPPGLN